MSQAELATISPEHPSPVSVLDTSVYRDDAPSPVKQTPAALKGKFLLFENFPLGYSQDNLETKEFDTREATTSNILIRHRVH